MKKLLLALLAAVLVLTAVVLVRAAGMDSLQPEAPTAEADARVELDSAGAVERFQGAIRIRTISHERVEDTDSAAFRAFHEYLAESYPLVHEGLEREVVGGLSLLYTWQGTDPEADPIVLMGHQDVVPVIPGTEEDWSHPPYGGVLADGYVWGRGTMDDKVSVIAILEAVEALVADGFQPRRTVYLAFGHDEEVGGVRGAKAIAELLASRDAEPYAFVLDEGGAVARGMVPGVEGAVALVGVAEKGYVNLELVVEGQGGHSSTPPEHTNIGILAQAIRAVEEDQFPAELQGPARDMFRWLAPEMSFGAKAAFANLWLTEPLVTRMLLADPSTASMVRTTTAVTIVEGGVKANVLPIRARALVNHRIIPGETRESVLERVRRVIDDERVQVRIFGDEGVDPSPVSDPQGDAFQMLARTIHRTLAGEDVVVTPYLVMGGTDAKHYSGSSENVFRFIPAPVDADALNRAHGTNERMSVEGLLTSVRFFQQLIRSSDGL